MTNMKFRLFSAGDYLPPFIRLLLAVSLFIYGIYLLFHNPVVAIAPLFLTAWLVFDYLRNGAVWLAFKCFRKGDLEAVRHLLGQTFWPQYLSSVSLAYYHWLKGVLESADERYAAARVHLLVSASGQLLTENDRSLVQCLLAEVALQDGDMETARQHTKMANALEHHNHVAGIIQSLTSRLD